MCHCLQLHVRYICHLSQLSWRYYQLHKLKNSLADQHVVTKSSHSLSFVEIESFSDLRFVVFNLSTIRACLVIAATVGIRTSRLTNWWLPQPWRPPVHRNRKYFYFNFSLRPFSHQYIFCYRCYYLVQNSTRNHFMLTIFLLLSFLLLRILWLDHHIF